MDNIRDIINGMSRDELKHVLSLAGERLELHLDQSRKQEVEAFRSKVASEAASLGINVVKLFCKSNAMRSVAPKYQNPSNLSQTWSGRGIRPKWFSLHIQSGMSVHDMLITPASPFEDTEK